MLLSFFIFILWLLAMFRLYYLKSRDRHTVALILIYTGIFGMLFGGTAPWIRHVDKQAMDMRVQMVSEDLIDNESFWQALCDNAGWSCSTASEAVIRGILGTDPTSESVWNFLRTNEIVNGYNLWRLARVANLPLKGIFYSLLALLVSAIIAVGLVEIGIGAYRYAGWSLMVSGSIAVFLLVKHVPDIDTFGFDDNFAMGFLSVMACVRVDGGVFLTLIAALVLLFGAFFLLATSDSEHDEEDLWDIETGVL